MTDLASSGVGWAPEACTLPTVDQPLLVAEFDALFTTSVRGGERLGPRLLRVSLAGGADVETSVRDLAARESDCCSFFTFTVATPEADRVQLDIEVPSEYMDVLDALEARAMSVRDEA